MIQKKPRATPAIVRIVLPIAENVKAAREKLGLTQPELAELTGMSQQGIASIESSKVERPRKLHELAKALRVTPDWLLGQDLVIEHEDGRVEQIEVKSAPNASFPPRYESFGGARVPLMGQTQAGMNGRFVLNGQTVAEVFCPPDLEGVAGAYAVLVYGESMEPKFEAGETVWLHPYLPVRRGDYVVAQIHDDENEAPSSYIKQFISKTGSVLTLKQFNPAEGEDEIMTFPANQVVSIHKIVFHKLP